MYAMAAKAEHDGTSANLVEDDILDVSDHGVDLERRSGESLRAPASKSCLDQGDVPPGMSLELRKILLVALEQRQHPKDTPSKRASPAEGVTTTSLTTTNTPTRRSTRFDRQNPSDPTAPGTPFHGFFTLFWVCISFLLLRVAAHNLHKHGTVLGRAEILHIMTDRDLAVLGLTDGVMYLGTSAGWALQVLVLKGYVSWAGCGWVLQNVWQAGYLGAVIWWTYYRDWPWTHTVFAVLHALVFLMKQHSYAFYNGSLSEVYRRRELVQTELRRLRPGFEFETRTKAEEDSAVSTSVHLASPNECLVRVDAGHGVQEDSDTATNSLMLDLDRPEVVASLTSAVKSNAPFTPSQTTTITYILQQELDTLNTQLAGRATTPTKHYPNNLTLSNWAEWTCLPTLVYELDYPRQDRISWPYVAEKTAACLGSIWVMIVVSQTYIYPLVQRTSAARAAGLPLAQRILDYPSVCMDIAFPMLLEQLLTWYVIWECVLNALAELTRFADRGFYGDWWNSVSWDQYARDWNRPVHHFLLRHVYQSSIRAWKLDRASATLVTFLLSASVHELVMWCLFKKLRGYLFVMQIMQVPLVSMSKTKLMRGRKMMGNVIFWIGLFLGPSVITSLYLIV